MNNNRPCPLCEKEADRKYSGHPGYKQSETFTIYHCRHCGTAFCHPQQVESTLYEQIYKNIGSLPGYSRYLKYAEQALNEKDPLKYLAQAEDIYWAIQQYFKTHKPRKILEIGSGHGYLTYALRCKGLDVTGLDISQTAVDAARKKYGDYFVCADLFHYCRSFQGHYDTVILTEVIEHVSDVKSFLKAIDLILQPGGDLVLTTPNRSLYPSDILWETEPPPVHLWWFSEKSLKVFANYLGYRLKLTDFSEYNRINPPDPYLPIRNYHPTRSSRFASDGQILHQGDFIHYPVGGAPQSNRRNKIKQFLKTIKVLYIVSAMKNKIQTAYRNIQKKINHRSRRTVLCAVLTKPKENHRD